LKNLEEMYCQYCFKVADGFKLFMKVPIFLAQLIIVIIGFPFYMLNACAHLENKRYEDKRK